MANAKTPMEPTATDQPPSQYPTTPQEITYLPTTEAYARWASVYDHDSNPLQALDDAELTTLLPHFLSLLPATGARVVDLGCGTGRNTMKLYAPNVHSILALDASAEMLVKFASKITIVSPGPHFDPVPEEEPRHSPGAGLRWQVYDMLDDPEGAKVAKIRADGVISTLVLEHVPLDAFFRAVSKMLRPGGLCLLTNMHPDMGARSQAGFKDPETGEKIRPVSYVHRIGAVVEEARRWEFEVIGEVREREARLSDVEDGVVGSRIEKWIGVKMWFGMVLKKASAVE